MDSVDDDGWEGGVGGLVGDYGFTVHLVLSCLSGILVSLGGRLFVGGRLLLGYVDVAEAEFFVEAGEGVVSPLRAAELIPNS